MDASSFDLVGSFRFSDFPKKVRDLLKLGGFWPVAVAEAIKAGICDANKLTDLVFYDIHPERERPDGTYRPLSPTEPNFSQLVEEWKGLKSFIVLPALKVTQCGKAPNAGATAAKGPYPVVNTLMPKEGPGFFCRMPESRRWGLPETIEALQQIGRLWFSANPQGPRFIISDISKRGGGQLCFNKGGCHKSHQIGLDVDIRTIRNDGQETSSAISYKNPKYSLALTKKLIDTIRSNGNLKVKMIAFLDPRISNLSRWSGHDRHLHVRFCMPPRYRSLINLNKTYSKSPPNYQCSSE
ncbi:MAG: hypothetical protein HC800_09340 [Phormidesmis sp. RL_2_1]|nr:hypothetical protein [Phormidesmis sp. RL_2_1]